MVLQLSDESGAASVISSFFSTFFAVAVSLFGEQRNTLAIWPALPHERPSLFIQLIWPVQLTQSENPMLAQG